MQFYIHGECLSAVFFNYNTSGHFIYQIWINNNYFLSTGKITKDSPLYKAIQVANPYKVIDAKRILDSGYYEGENKEKLDFLIGKNQYILNSINIDLLSPDFSDYSKELIDKIARYRRIQEQLCSEKDKLKVFNKMIKNIDASEKNINRTLGLIDTLRYETFTNEENAKLIESIGEDITPQQAQNLKDYLLRKETAIYGKRNKDSILASINTKEDILNFDEVLVSRCDDIFHNPNSTTDEKINALTSKYFASVLLRSECNLRANDRCIFSRYECYKRKIFKRK